MTQFPSESKRGGVAGWMVHPLWLPVAIWLLLVSWRPFVLGFYHDDWLIAQPLTEQTYSKLFVDQASRPIYALLIAGSRWLLSPDPFVFQALLALLQTVSAYAVYRLGRALCARVSSDVRTGCWAGAVAAAMWLAAPWDFGVSVWPTTFPAQFSVGGFCWMVVILLGPNSYGRRLLGALACFLLISLISELFWLSFIPLILALWLDEMGRGMPGATRRAFWMMLCFCLVQATLGSLNRILVWFGVGINRSFNHDFLATAWLSLQLLPQELGRSLSMPGLFCAACAVAALCMLWGAWRSRQLIRVGGVLAMVAAGSLLSLLIFALAGYRVESLGVFSRTTVVITTWLSLVPVLVVANCPTLGKNGQRLAVASLAVILAVMALSSLNNLAPWRKSWMFEHAVLENIPVQELLREPNSSAFILVDAVKPEGAGEGLEAYWDTTAALSARSAQLGQKFGADMRYFAAILDKERKLTVWDGKTLTQAWCNAPASPLWSLPASGRVYVWDHAAQRLSGWDHPVTFGCP